MPDPAPVTMATLSFNSLTIFLSFYVIDIIMLLFETRVSFLIMNGISLRVISGMMLLDTQDLLIFKHIADLYSILRVTEKLDYVQSNVSQRMKILEDELGARLLIRSNRGVRLTEEGTTLYKYAEDILKLMQDTKSAINKNN